MAAAEAVAEQFQALPMARAAGYVAGYWAVAGELPLHRVQLCLHAEQIWCLPILQADGGLRFAPWRQGDALVSNRYGIPEPACETTLPPGAMSVVLLPLLGFDRRGQRLGSGAGYYDRSFAFRQTRAAPPCLLGVGYACQELATLTAEPWDVPLDAILCETEVILPA